MSGGKKTGSGPLALKRELRELTGEVQVKHRAVDETAAQLERLEREIARLTEDLEALRAQQQKQEKEALALDHEHRKMAEEFARAQSRFSVARLELERLRQEGSACPRTAGARSAGAGREGNGARDRRAGSGAVARGFRRAADAKRTAWRKSTANLRAELAGFEERQRSERASAGPA